MAEALDVIAPRLLTPDQAAKYLGLPSRWSVYRLVKSGQLASVPLAGKLRLDRHDLDRLVEEKKGKIQHGPELQLSVLRSTPARRARLAPLARRARSDGDRTVTRDAEVPVAANRSDRRPDLSSGLPLRKEGC